MRENRHVQFPGQGRRLGCFLALREHPLCIQGKTTSPACLEEDIPSRGTPHFNSAGRPPSFLPPPSVFNISIQKSLICMFKQKTRINKNPPTPLLHKWPHTATTVLHLGFPIGNKPGRRFPVRILEGDKGSPPGQASLGCLSPLGAASGHCSCPCIAPALGLWTPGRSWFLLCKHLRAAARTAELSMGRRKDRHPWRCDL